MFIGIPTLDNIPIEVAGCLIGLCAQRNDIELHIIQNSMISDARNVLFRQALEKDDDLLFIDSDIIFPVEGVQRLLDRNDPIVTGIYYGRKPPYHEPIIYSDLKVYRKTSEAINYGRITKDYFQVAGCGMGFCLIRKEAIKQIAKKWPDPFNTITGMGEDLSFCYRAGLLGIPVYADATIDLKHKGHAYYDASFFDADSPIYSRNKEKITLGDKIHSKVFKWLKIAR